MPQHSLVPVLHERGIQLRLADRVGLDQQSRGRPRGHLKQRLHAPIGNSRQPFDLLLIGEDDIFTGGLIALHTPKDERIGERNGGPRCSDGRYLTRSASAAIWSILSDRQWIIFANVPALGALEDSKIGPVTRRPDVDQHHTALAGRAQRSWYRNQRRFWTTIDLGHMKVLPIWRGMLDPKPPPMTADSGRLAASMPRHAIRLCSILLTLSESPAVRSA